MNSVSLFVAFWILAIRLPTQIPIHVGIWEKFDKYSLPPQNVYVNPSEIKNGKDDDGDGYIDNINGIGFDDQEQIVSEYFYCGVDTKESYDHGTAVASILLKHNPDVILHGVGFVPTTQRISQNKLLQKTIEERVNGLSEEYKRMKFFIDESLAYFSKQNCKVVNISWGLSLAPFIKNNPNLGHSQYEKELNAKVWLGKMNEYLRAGFSRYPTIIFVVAAGNEGMNINKAVDVPATIQLNNVVVVGALAENSFKRAEFSNFGSDIIYAPGTAVSCTGALKINTVASGTSLAAPVVTALIANLWANDNRLDEHFDKRQLNLILRALKGK